MSILQKPNKKSATNVAIAGVGLMAGYKLGDGVSAVMPESAATYKNWIGAAVGFGVALCVNPSTTSGQAVQAIALGMGTNGLVNGVNELLVPAIEEKTGGTATDKFINAFVGHKTPTLPAEAAAETARLAMAWEQAEPVEDMWNRDAIEKEARVFTIKAG